jgi:hypothetical protein
MRQNCSRPNLVAQLAFMPDSPNISTSAIHYLSTSPIIASYAGWARVAWVKSCSAKTPNTRPQSRSQGVAARVTKSESRLRRFKQEARAILALNHPNILTIYEIGQTDDSYYIATEYIEAKRCATVSGVVH